MAGRIATIAVLTVFATAGLGGDLAQSEARERTVANAECGTPRNDWVCRKRGPVSIWVNGAPETAAESVIGHRPRALPLGTKVRAEAGAEARIRFRGKASCDLGPAGVPTQIVTRVGLEGLFSQELGSTFCRSLDGSFARASFFCDATGECPVLFLSNGKFDARGLETGDARASTPTATASRVVITACTGTFELRIFTREGVKTVRKKTPELAKTRIVVTQSSAEAEGAWAEAWGYSISSVSGTGICRE